MKVLIGLSAGLLGSVYGASVAFHEGNVQLGAAWTIAGCLFILTAAQSLVLVKTVEEVEDCHTVIRSLLSRVMTHLAQAEARAVAVAERLDEEWVEVNDHDFGW